MFATNAIPQRYVLTTTYIRDNALTCLIDVHESRASQVRTMPVLLPSRLDILTSIGF